MSTGMAMPPARAGGQWDPSNAMALRTMRGDATKDAMGSLLFPERPNKPTEIPIPASQVASYGTSLNHPFHHVLSDRPADVADRLRPSLAASQHSDRFAGIFL